MKTFNLRPSTQKGKRSWKKPPRTHIRSGRRQCECIMLLLANLDNTQYFQRDNSRIQSKLSMNQTMKDVNRPINISQNMFRNFYMHGSTKYFTLSNY